MFCLASRDCSLHVPPTPQKILDWNALNGIQALLFVLSCITPYCWTGSPRVTQNRLSSLFPWIIKLLFFRGSACYTACGILVPRGGVEPGPLHWEHGVLVTRPGNSPIFFFSIRTAYKISVPQTGWTWGHGSESLKSKPLGHQRTPPEQFKKGPEFKINYTCFYIWLEI